MIATVGESVLHLGDCREVMRPMAAESIDAIVTDPPYGFKFMGKGWDHGVPGVEFWAEALRVLKPGGHLLAFGGPRTFHRLTCGIEDAGFEIRDCVMWVFGSGFPKSLDVSKSLDRMEQKKWFDIAKAINSLNQSTIIEAWINDSKNATPAADESQKNLTEVGSNTKLNDSVADLVRVEINHANLNANAIVAELLYCGARRTSEGGCRFAQEVAGKTITESSEVASIAGERKESQEAKPCKAVFIALSNVLEWLDENQATTNTAAEALATSLGKNQSLQPAAIGAICAALQRDLKRTILSQSKTFLGLDTENQTAVACATIAITTASTKAHLITFMADTAKKIAIDKAAGAVREVTKSGSVQRDGNYDGWDTNTSAERPRCDLPATDAAKQWNGWGTALKPGWEPIIMARKPIVGTVAQNVQRYGTGAINVDACRIAGEKPDTTRGAGGQNGRYGPLGEQVRIIDDGLGRWPANLVHDGSDEVLAGFPQTVGQIGGNNDPNGSMGYHGGGIGVTRPGIPDAGSAARFFYCAKANRSDREFGLDDAELQILARSNGAQSAASDGEDYGGAGEVGLNKTARVKNNHPTVKPVGLMRWLVRLVTPPGGTVLDMFLGSGSTGRACAMEQFKFIGIEKDAGYFEIARRRIAAAEGTVGLFGMES